jgi:hypothetical protein
MTAPIMASEQSAGGVITGDNNTQTNSNYNYQTSLAAQGVITGSENNMINTNINGDVNLIDKNTMSTSSSQFITNNFLPNPVSTHYILDTGPVSSQVMSIYDGEVITIPNDDGREILQRKGEIFRYTIKSSIPVLAYLMNSRDDYSVQAQSNAPVYDTVFKKFSHGNLVIEYKQKHLSTFQQFAVTMPENGRYSLVIDTRVSQRLNGGQSTISANTIDLYYVIEKLSGGNYTTVHDSKYIGTTETYPIGADGNAVTS